MTLQESTENFNPYKAPETELEGKQASRPTDLSVTENMISALKQTRPWVLFLSILGFIGAGFMVLAGLMMLVLGVVGSSIGTGGDGMPVAASIGMSAMYIVMAAVYVIPCIFLIKYAIAIRRIGLGGAEAIEDALVRQKNFWRNLGIMVLVLLGLYFLAAIVGVIAAVAIGASQAM